jgi:hypothetical protein
MAPATKALPAQAPQQAKRRSRPSASRLLSLGSLAWLALCYGPSAWAYAPAIELIPGTSSTGETLPRTPPLDNNRTYGYEFNTIIDRQIDAIGVFDANNDGLEQFHQVGLWMKNDAGSYVLKAQYSFDPAAPSCVSDSLWCWLPIPVTDFKKGAYMIAATWNGLITPTDPLAFQTPPPSTSGDQSWKPIDPQLNVINPIRSDTERLLAEFGIPCEDPMPLDVDLNQICAFPITRADPDAGGYFSAVVSFYTPTSTVPGPLPLFGAAAFFGWKRQLRKRIQQA